MNSPDDFLSIDTPENVAFGYPIAGIGSRFIAALIDTSIIVALQIVVFILAGLLARNTFNLSLDDLAGEQAAAWILGAAGLLSFIFLWGYYIFFEILWNGQSPGKRATRLRVLRSDGTPITLNESLIRNLVRLVDFLPGFYAVGVVAMFIDSRSRRLGDLAAGTLVVREEASLDSLDALAAPPSPVNRYLHMDDLDLPTERLTPQDLDLLRSFLRRRNEFTDPDVVGAQILDRLVERMDIPPGSMEGRDVLRLLEQIDSIAS